MNIWLANGFAKFNGAIAVVIILVGTIFSAILGIHNFVAGVFSAVCAFIIAVLFCGPMAAILDIRDQLIKMNAPR